MPTRRNFLLNCSAVAVTAAMAPATAISAPLRLREVPLEAIPMSAFASQLNAVFRVQEGGGTAVGLQLIEVQSTPGFASAGLVAEDSANEKFSLFFRGPLSRPLEQGSYGFEAPGIGRFAMFIVPIGSTETSHCYFEAIFNRAPGGRLPQAGEGNIPKGRGRSKRRRSETNRAS
jgi:hypothetical protein